MLVEHTPVYATVMRFMDYSNVEDRLKNQERRYDHPAWAVGIPSPLH